MGVHARMIYEGGKGGAVIKRLRTIVSDGLRPRAFELQIDFAESRPFQYDGHRGG